MHARAARAHTHTHDLIWHTMPHARAYVPTLPAQCDELMCQGVKPWDDDAGAALGALYDF